MATLKLTNSNLLDITSLKICPDFTNILADTTIAAGSVGNITMTQDGFIMVYGCTGHCSLKINNVSVGFIASGSYDGEVLARAIFVKKGDVISKNSYYGTGNSNDGYLKYKLLGLK